MLNKSRWGRQVGRATELIGWAKQIYQTEGLKAFLRKAAAFIVRILFEYRTYILILHRLEKVELINESDLMPETDNLTLEVVLSNNEVDRLEARGLAFRSRARDSHVRLDSGAAAICLFSGNDLVHIGWVAMTRESRDSLGEPPLSVDFSKGEGCRGGVWTHPGFRRLGLHTYGNFKRLEFMHGRGLVVSRDAIARSNSVAMRTNVKLGAEPYAEGRYLKVLWWKSWREKPLAHPGCEATRPPGA